MRRYCSKYIVFLSSILLVTSILSCSGRTGERPNTKIKPASISVEKQAENIIKLISPDENTAFKLHEPIRVNISLEDGTIIPDSVLIFFNGKYINALKKGPWEYTIPSSDNFTTGRKSLKVAAYKEGKQQNTITRFMVIYSDVIPKRYGYKIINSYPHDKEAFTQGLVFDKGVFFEGTGQKAGSCLREVEPETGKVIRQLNLDGTLFGEGITIFRDRIYQVTWQNKVGFIYDKATFKIVNKIYYPTEGWGLTTVDDRIVMSDGTNVLYYYEPDMFTVVSRIEVYDNKKKVDQLNELEYINGEIWANIWMTDLIARIDPSSGKVLGYINLEGLLPRSERTSDTDVLNGIAFDISGKRIFVTGKKWPKLYEIKVTE